GGAVDGERVADAVALLESRGLRVLCHRDLTARHRYLAGDDATRREELGWALSAPEVRAVFLARGGYGSQRILDAVTPEQLGEPRAVVGFSDNTALLDHLRLRAGWCVVHGPHPRRLPAGEFDAVLGCLGLFGEPARTVLRDLERLNPGPWEARTAEVGGGCLSLLAASQGTPYAFRAAGRIVFIEDVSEPAYRIDRMLLQLRTSRALDGAAALVFGRPAEFLPPDQGAEDRTALDQLLREFAEDCPFPVLAGAPCGHCTPNLPLPFGPRSLLDPARGTLAFVEDAVR
ncbi:MAG TPA: LD-carboxypeptidase, partial [Deferrisomatales bacterium]|nr:LD-carboxypeptidase [Deferrisomatales bacterium]